MPIRSTPAYYPPPSYSALFTFSAKERDVETGLSYFGARYYSSELSIWLSVDPQSDKYPSFSPYVYCANNPIKLVDPNGEDIISVDQKTGETTITKQEGKDILRCGKNEITLSGNGVFGKAYNGVVKEGTLLVGMTKKDSRDVFNFMADNTNVEWGYLEIQNEDGSSSFMVGSANDSDGESQVYNMAMAAKSGSVLRYDHSHPKTNNPGLLDWAPSTPDTATDKEKVDTKAWSNLLERNPNASFGIRYGGETQTFIDGGVVTGAYPLINKYMN